MAGGIEKMKELSGIERVEEVSINLEFVNAARTQYDSGNPSSKEASMFPRALSALSMLRLAIATHFPLAVPFVTFRSGALGTGRDGERGRREVEALGRGAYS